MMPVCVSVRAGVGAGVIVGVIAGVVTVAGVVSASLSLSLSLGEGRHKINKSLTLNRALFVVIAVTKRKE